MEKEWREVREGMERRYDAQQVFTAMISFTQSESYIMTVSAEVRLIPSPPALVLRRNTIQSGLSLNMVICFCLSKKAMVPSSLL